MHRKGFFARLADLWRGFWGVKLSDAEARNAEGVYHNAIAEHVQHHERLKEAIARLVYLRNRMQAELQERESDLALVEKALGRAAVENADERALGLIRKRRTLAAEVERLRAELASLEAQSDKAKQGLQQINAAIRNLKEERAEMLARKAHALARRDVKVALDRLTDTSRLYGSVTALESVRESILRLEQTVDLDEEQATAAPGEISMEALRREALEEADREALLELKRSRGLLPPASEPTAHVETVETEAEIESIEPVEPVQPAERRRDGEEATFSSQL